MTKQAFMAFIDQIRDMRHELYADAYMLLALDSRNWLVAIAKFAKDMQKMNELPYLADEVSIASNPGSYGKLNDSLLRMETLGYEMVMMRNYEDKMSSAFQFMTNVDGIQGIMESLVHVDEQPEPEKEEETDA